MPRGPPATEQPAEGIAFGDNPGGMIIQQLQTNPPAADLWAFVGSTDIAAAANGFWGVDLGPVARCVLNMAGSLRRVELLVDAGPNQACTYQKQLQAHLCMHPGACATLAADDGIRTHAVHNSFGRDGFVKTLRGLTSALEAAYSQPAQPQAAATRLYLINGGTPLQASALVRLAHSDAWAGHLLEIDAETGVVIEISRVCGSP